MNDNPEFSVIIPVYNCEKYIERCINSVLKQNYENIEIIVIDDGSQDNSLKLLNSYANNIDNFKIISQSNMGVSKSRNNALLVSKGKYVIFLDADDYLDEGYFKKIIKIVDTYPEVELINFAFYSEVENKNTIIQSDIIRFKERYYDSKTKIKDDLVDLWDNSMLYNIWNKVYINEIIRNNGIKFPNISFGEDVIFNREYLLKVHKFYNSSTAFYHYVRERKNAATNKYISNLFDIRKKEYYEFNEYFELWNVDKDKYIEFSCRRFVERVLGCIENTFCSKKSNKEKFNEIKMIINDDLVKTAIKYVKPKSKIIELTLLILKFRNTILAYYLGICFHTFKQKYPGLFNKIKNRR